YSNISQKTKQIMNLLLVNNFYPVISYRRVEKESDVYYCIRFGHSLWSANQLSAQGTKQIMNLLLVNNFYPVISYRRVEKESDVYYCIRFGHSLWSANQLPAQGVKRDGVFCKLAPKERISIISLLADHLSILFKERKEKWQKESQRSPQRIRGSKKLSDTFVRSHIVKPPE
ncbi:unnamed protein product, partial [Heterotrigona itama]